MSDFELFAVGDPPTRQRKFMESIDMILRIWAQDPPYDIQGEFWNVQIKKAILPELGVGFMPKPLQQPHPPIHISIASPDSASAKLAGSKRAGASPPTACRRAVAFHWQTYIEARPVAASAQARRLALSRLSSWRRPTPRAEERIHGEHALQPLITTLTCA